MAPEIEQEVSTEISTPEVSPAATENKESGHQGPDTASKDTAAKEGDTPITEGDAGIPAAAAAYKARDKFKVMVLGSDEQKEHEVPPLLRGIMKDAESEKQVIELLEKAYGLEPVKASRAEIRKERDTFKSDLGNIQRSIAEVRNTFQRGDIDGFLDKLEIPHDRMLQWALDKVNYSQLPPEQQRIFDERRDAQRRAYTAEQQAQTYESQLQETNRRAKTELLNAGLARPDVKAFADAYDTKVGKPGSFFSEVAQTGNNAWIQSNGTVDLSPEQAIEQTLAKWRNFIQVESAPAQVTAGQAASQSGPGTQATSQAKAAVIPNVQGGSQSPMKSKPRSVADLKKLSAAMQAS